MVRFPDKEAVPGYLQGVFQNFSYVAFVERELSVTNDGRTVFIEALGDLRTAIGDLLYSNRYVFKFDLDQGRITSIKEYANPVTASPILGIPLGIGN